MRSQMHRQPRRHSHGIREKQGAYQRWFLGTRVLQALCVLRIRMACTRPNGLTVTAHPEVASTTRKSRAWQSKGRRELELAINET